jgi:hypothetical protein
MRRCPGARRPAEGPGAGVRSDGRGWARAAGHGAVLSRRCVGGLAVACYAGHRSASCNGNEPGAEWRSFDGSAAHWWPVVWCRTLAVHVGNNWWIPEPTGVEPCVSATLGPRALAGCQARDASADGAEQSATAFKPPIPSLRTAAPPRTHLDHHPTRVRPQSVRRASPDRPVRARLRTLQEMELRGFQP